MYNYYSTEEIEFFHNYIREKAIKNKVDTKKLIGLTWEEADFLIDEEVRNRKYEVDKKIKRAYAKNKSYYDSLDNSYSMDKIMESYNEYRQYY